MNSFVKIYIASLVIGGSVLGLGLNQAYKKNMLLSERLDQVIRDNDSLSYQVTTIKLEEQEQKEKEEITQPASVRPGRDRLNRLEQMLTHYSARKARRTSTSTKGNLLRVKQYVNDIEKHLNALKEKINQLNGLIQHKDEELANLDKANLSLKQDLDQALSVQAKLEAGRDEDIKRLKEELFAKDSEILNLSATRLNLESQINELHNKISSLSSANSFLEEQLYQIQQDKFSLDKSLKTKDGQLEKLNQESAVLNQKLSQAVEREDKLREGLEGKIGELKDRLIDKDTDLSKLNSIKVDLENKIRDLESQNTRLSQSLDDFSGLSDTYASLEEEVIGLRREKIALQAELEKANSDFSRQGELYQVLNKRIAELTAQLYSKKSDDAVGFQELDSLKIAKDSLESELKIKEEELSGFEARLDRLRAEKDKFSLSAEEKEKEISNLKIVLSNMESKLNRFEGELKIAKQLQSQTSSQLNEQLAVNNKLKKKLMDIYVELELLNAEKQIYRKK